MNVNIAYSEIAAQGFCATDICALRSLVRASVHNRELLRCMEHPLGFYHFRLFSDGPVNLRLHFWPEKNRPDAAAVTPYHDHVWSLQSCVLAGTIDNMILTIEENPTGPFVVANIEQRDGVDFVVPSSDRVEITKTDTSTFTKGDYYSIAPRMFHCSRVPTGTSTVTVVRAEVTERGGPRTLVPIGYSGQAPPRTFVCDSSSAIIMDQLEAILE